jgi:hypothetical protein
VPRCWRRSKPWISSIKGGDYRADQVVGRELVEADGGEVVLVALAPGYSTSRLVDRSARSTVTLPLQALQGRVAAHGTLSNQIGTEET